MIALRGTGTLRQGRGSCSPRRPKTIVYPDSDGKPMGESELHRDEMWRLIYLLQAHFAAVENIHVTGNLILYYEEGNPRVSVSPDVMVVKGVPKHRRETYLLWQEGMAPCFVIEVTSSSARTVDEHKKRDLYARLGVQEYVLYDPRFPGLETRRPPLRGYRLTPAGYEAMEHNADGSLVSDELQLRLVLGAGRLQFYDPRTGERLLSIEERAERAELEAQRADLGAQRARAAEVRADAEAAAREAAEARIADLEALLRDHRPLS
jgi:Uma2 family endonuclease